MTREELTIWTLFASAALKYCQRACEGNAPDAASYAGRQADAMLAEWRERAKDLDE